MKKMELRTKLSTLTLAVAIAMFSVGVVPTANSANHVKNSLSYDQAANVVDVNLTMSVDWDYDNPPTVQGTVLNRAYIEDCLREYAKSMFQMSEGRLRVGTTTIYRNSSYMGNVSIRLLNKDGRANGSASGYGVRGWRTLQYVLSQQRVETPFQIGRTITHEMGHYLLGIYDEYQERGRPLSPDLIYFPADGDTPKDTMMHNHEQFLKLSTAGEYTDPAQQATAHFRVYNESAWQTLVRDPQTDTAAQRALRGGVERPRIQSLVGSPLPPNAGALTAAEGGWDSKIKFEYVLTEGTGAYYAIDRSLPGVDLAAAKQTAIQSVRKLAVGSIVSVAPFEIEVNPLVISKRIISTDADRDAIATAIEGITTSTMTQANAPDFVVNAAMQEFSSGVDGQLSLFLLTKAEATVSAPFADALKGRSIALTPLAIRSATAAAGGFIAKRAGAKSLPAPGRVSLADAAQTTGGNYLAVKKAHELEAKATAAVALATGGDEQTAVSSETPLLKAGQSFELPVSINAGVDESLTFEVSEPETDGGRLSYALVNPAGQVILSTAVPAGITYKYDSTSKSAMFRVEKTAAGFQGSWKIRLTATADLRDVAFIEAYVESDLSVNAQVAGTKQSDASPVVVTVRVEGDRAIAGAEVKVDLYDADGDLVKADILAKDDGKLPDISANDGLYTVALPITSVGEYYVVAKARGTSTTRLTNVGNLKKGENPAEVALAGFNREFELGFLVTGLSTGDFDKDGIADSVEASEGLNPFVKDNDVFSNNRLYVMQTFRDFFGRNSDAAGQAFWEGRLASGADTRASLADQFINSAEFAGTQAPIARLYQAFFLRSSDFDGQMYWAGQLRSGVKLDAIAESFAQSQEFRNRYSSLTDSAFIDLVYTNTLGRPADAAGKSFWFAELTAKRVTRGSLMARFSESAEFVNANKAKISVQLLYLGMLRRAGDASGVTFWTAEVNRGAPVRNLINSFLGSTEYRGRFLPQ